MNKSTPLVEFNSAYYKYPNGIGDYLSAIFELGTNASAHEHRLKEAIHISNTRFGKQINNDFVVPSDGDLLNSMLATHGMFARRFFARSIQQRVAKQFAEADIELAEFSQLLWEAWRRDTSGVVTDVFWAIGVVVNQIYDQKFIEAIESHRVHSDLRLWFDKYSQPRGCILCNRRFRVIDLPSWIYFGSNAYSDCCFCCPMELPGKEELKLYVPAFVETCGFIPSSNISPINYAFCSRLPSDIKHSVFRAYSHMGGIEHVKQTFGSWFQGLAETGALPGGVLTTTRGVKCLAQDGHVCLSLDEQQIDNWLTSHGIPHEREPRYPKDALYNPTGNRRADWKVGETFIEYFGLTGDEQYDKKTSEKILLAQRHRFALIEIYPVDLGDLDSHLTILIDSIARKPSRIEAVATPVVSSSEQIDIQLGTIERAESAKKRTNKRPKASTAAHQTSQRQTEEHGIPVRWMEGTKLQSPEGANGKALYRGKEGWAVTIEQFALEAYGLSGFTGKWTENQYWWGIMSLLFWDVIYARLPGVFNPMLAFPGTIQDIPTDLFAMSFYDKRKDLIARRIAQLTQAQLFGLRKPNIELELRRAFRRYHNLPFRPAAWTEKFTEDDIVVAATTLTGKQLVMIMHRLLENFGGHRTGLPDLFLSREGTPLFVEVKSTREKIRDNQIVWLSYLQKDIGLPVEICRVAQSEGY